MKVGHLENDTIIGLLLNSPAPVAAGPGHLSVSVIFRSDALGFRLKRCHAANATLLGFPW